MSPRSPYLPIDRRSWLLAIGSRLRAEYDAVAQPVPERLASLLKELEGPAVGGMPGPPGDVAHQAKSPAESTKEESKSSPGSQAPPTPRAPPLQDCQAALS